MITREAEEKIISKIKKLLELTTSPNEAEASLAMSQAQKLMARYAINFVDENKEKDVVLSEVWWPSGASKSGLIEQIPAIVAIISPIFGVHGLVHTKNGQATKLELYGFKVNLEIAKYAIDSIIAQGILDARAEYKKVRSTFFNLSFWTGFSQGLKQKFGVSHQESNELVVYDKVKEAVAKLAKGHFRGEQFDGEAYAYGIESGKRAEIRKGLTSTSTGKLLN